MTEATHDNHEEPIWARADAFPIAPAGYGWLDFKGKSHPCDTSAELIRAIHDDRDPGVERVWTPAHKRLILPDELVDAAEAVHASRQRRAASDLLDAQERTRWFGGLLAGLAAYLFYQGWQHAPQVATLAERQGLAWHTMLTSVSMGITLLLFLVFAFIPWYQARKRIQELGRWTDADRLALVPILRFESWLAAQSAPLTNILLGMLTLVALAQVLSSVKPADLASWGAIFQTWHGTAEAGLIKDAYRHGDYWRLFTAPWLHGNIVHLLMNGSAMLYLGKRLEVFARWPHLALVFLFAACIGGEASACLVTRPSVGASGGLMGWLGFLLVFESLHHRLVPRPASRRLLAGVVLTGVIGVIGYRFIDNAAHLGGLVAGMAYALIVFPKSTSPSRPKPTLPDRLAGGAAVLVLCIAAGVAILKSFGLMP